MSWKESPWNLVLAGSDPTVYHDLSGWTWSLSLGWLAHSPPYPGGSAVISKRLFMSYFERFLCAVSSLISPWRPSFINSPRAVRRRYFTGAPGPSILQSPISSPTSLWQGYWVGRCGCSSGFRPKIPRVFNELVPAWEQMTLGYPPLKPRVGPKWWLLLLPDVYICLCISNEFTKWRNEWRPHNFHCAPTPSECF